MRKRNLRLNRDRLRRTRAGPLFGVGRPLLFFRERPKAGLTMVQRVTLVEGD